MKLLDKNELTRLGSKSGASEVKQHKWFSKVNWGLLRNTQPPVSFGSWKVFSPHPPRPLGDVVERERFLLRERRVAATCRLPSSMWFSTLGVLFATKGPGMMG